MENKSINLEVTNDEALVLFEMLSRFSNTDVLSIEHQAEQRALWNLTCIFEKVVSEAFDGEYEKSLSAARERLKDED
ncbi:hypothetical protein [Sulfurovum sp.]|uniref:hypothetical protein n=1 Tax=Sulfurovum sp. TaxID=1969726 RepID=UPI0035634EC6